MLPAPRTQQEPKRAEQKGFSEDEAERVAGGAKYQAAKPLSQRVEDNAFHCCTQKINFDCVTNVGRIFLDNFGVLD